MKDSRLGLFVVGVHVIDSVYLLRNEVCLLQRAVGLAVAEACALIAIEIL